MKNSNLKYIKYNPNTNALHFVYTNRIEIKKDLIRLGGLIWITQT